jgi:apolipoprotein D and lipocalin family protein
VGEPDRKYLWMLSRTPALDDSTYRKILDQIASSGYDPERLVKTPSEAVMAFPLSFAFCGEGPGIM